MQPVGCIFFAAGRVPRPTRAIPARRGYPPALAPLAPMVATALVLSTLLPAPQQEPKPKPTFTKKTLSTQFLCEGAAFGDLDGDGKNDIVAGPWWYRGPDFTEKHSLYPAKQFP